MHQQRRPRRRVVDKRRTSLYTTAAPDGHRHLATFDTETGQGRTDVVAGHFHFVEDLQVSEIRGHHHELSTTRGLR